MPVNSTAYIEDVRRAAQATRRRYHSLCALPKKEFELLVVKALKENIARGWCKSKEDMLKKLL